MSYGLRVWDSSGALLIDISDRLVRAHGTYTVGSVGGRSTKTISVPGLNPSDGTWFYLVVGAPIFFDIKAISNGLTVYNAYSTTIDSFCFIDVIRG